MRYNAGRTQQCPGIRLYFMDVAWMAACYGTGTNTQPRSTLLLWASASSSWGCYHMGPFLPGLEEGAMYRWWTGWQSGLVKELQTAHGAGLWNLFRNVSDLTQDHGWEVRALGLSGPPTLSLTQHVSGFSGYLLALRSSDKTFCTSLPPRGKELPSFCVLCPKWEKSITELKLFFSPGG